MTKEGKLRIFAWGLSTVVVFIAVIAWGETYRWRMSKIGIYQLFPLLGLTAFSLMWSHYIVGAVRRYFGVEKAVLKSFFELTAVAVLVAILLHPGLLALQLWQDGFGLPPGSSLEYVGPAAKIFAIFGYIALVLFLLFEFRRLYQSKPWWKFIEYASDFAMVLIYIHALRLGGALQLDWYRAIWYFYGLTFLGALIYTYFKKREQTLPK